MTAEMRPFFKFAVRNQPSGVIAPFEFHSEWVEDPEEWQQRKDRILSEGLHWERMGLIRADSICLRPVVIRKWGYSYLYEINLYGDYFPIAFGITSKVEPGKEAGVYQEEL